MTLALPAPALRRSWLAAWIDDNAGAFVFRQLLRQLAPGLYRELLDYSGMTCYRALLAHVGTLFPIFETDFGPEDIWGEGSSECEQAVRFGIPVHGMGLDDEYVAYNIDGIYPSILVVLGMLSIWPDDEYENVWDLSAENTLRRLPKAVRPQIQAFYQAGMKQPRVYTHAPRGREWRAPWDGVADLVDWCRHNTGSAILDYSNMDIEEMGEYPRWRIEEIRGFAADWKRYKPVWDRIEALTKHVNGNPAWLPLLAGLLAGDTQSRQDASRPKDRTLVSVFTRRRA